MTPRLLGIWLRMICANLKLGKAYLMREVEAFQVSSKLCPLFLDLSPWQTTLHQDSVELCLGCACHMLSYPDLGLGLFTTFSSNTQICDKQYILFTLPKHISSTNKQHILSISEFRSIARKNMLQRSVSDCSILGIMRSLHKKEPPKFCNSKIKYLQLKYT